MNTSEQLETIVKGLRISYSNDIDVGSYLDLLDGKTTKAIREIVKKITSDPYSIKFSERLNAKIYEVNKEIEEIGKSKASKFYQSVSDIAIYGGSKYLEGQSNGLIKPNKADAHKTSEWLASKLFDLHAKATRKDWTFAQVYKTRLKIEKCKNAM
jgi:hypothetical protein